MWSVSRALAVAGLLAPLLAVAGCGGRVVGVGDTSGAGGSGAAPSAAGGAAESDASAAGGHSSAGGGATGGAPSTQPCTPPETYCPNWGTCIDLTSNPLACGSCTTACPFNGACVGGQCPLGQCAPGLTWCTSANGYTQCEDLLTSAADCGACANACGPYESCVNGKCVAPDCPGTTYCRDRGCVDTTSDVYSCGACGQTCAGPSIFNYDPYTCVDGKCTCSPHAVPCAGGCATEFWYCPTGSASSLDVCNGGARTPKEACACRFCLSQVEDCAKDLGCINSMDYSLSHPCAGCSLFGVGDQNGKPSALAASLTDCMNTNCLEF